MTVEPLFKSTDDALRFAFNYSCQQYGASAMASLMRGAIGKGKGLVGIDGAGQSGMVRRELKALTPAHRALLIARYAPPDLPCECRAPCCSRRKPNGEWVEALCSISQQAAPLFAGRLSNDRMRRHLISTALAGEQVSYVDLAEQYGVNRETVAAHDKILREAIIGTRSKIGELDRAIALIDAALHEVGIVGEVAAA